MGDLLVISDCHLFLLVFQFTGIQALEAEMHFQMKSDPITSLPWDICQLFRRIHNNSGPKYASWFFEVQLNIPS